MCSVSGKHGHQHIYLQHGVMSILSPLLRSTAQKKIPFKILLLIDNTLSHPGALMEIYSKINAVDSLVSSLLTQDPFATYGSRNHFDPQVLLFNKYNL